MSEPAADVAAEKFPDHVDRAHSARVFGLDLLRAVAILSVVFAHDFVVLYRHAPAWFGLFGHGGFYGVELFFVLSGFLIGRILIRDGARLGKTSTLSVFYIRRWFRTLPLFALFLGVNVILELILNDHHLRAGEILAHAFFLPTLTAYHPSFFSESWSLAIEEWFYLLFPAAVWLGLQFRKSFDGVFLTAAAAFFLFSTIGRMLSALNPGATWAESQRMIVIYRFDALMIGVFAAWLSFHFPSLWKTRAPLCALAGLLLLLGMYATLWQIVDHRLAFGDDSYFARTFRFTLVSLGFALLLPIGSQWKLARETFLSTAVRRIALWSYALYLVHLPVAHLVTRYFFKGWKTSSLAGLSSFALQISASILISALLYRFFESRLTHLRDKVAPAAAHFFDKNFASQET